MAAEVKFYDKNKNHIRTVKGAVKDGKVTAELPPGAYFCSTEIDGHALHPVPDWRKHPVTYE